MGPIRAFELAKELNVPLPRLKKEAEAIGIKVRNPLAQLNKAEADNIRTRFRTPAETAPAPKQQAQRRRKKAVSSKSAKSQIADASGRASARVAPTELPHEEVPAPVAPAPPVGYSEAPPEEDTDYEAIVESYIPPPVARKRAAVPAVAPPPRSTSAGGVAEPVDEVDERAEAEDEAGGVSIAARLEGASGRDDAEGLASLAAGAGPAAATPRARVVPAESAPGRGGAAESAAASRGGAAVARPRPPRGVPPPSARPAAVAEAPPAAPVSPPAAPPVSPAAAAAVSPAAAAPVSPANAARVSPAAAAAAPTHAPRAVAGKADTQARPAAEAPTRVGARVAAPGVRPAAAAPAAVVADLATSPPEAPAVRDAAASAAAAAAARAPATRPAAVRPPGSAPAIVAAERPLGEPAASASAVAAQPERKGPGMVRPAMPRPEPQAAPTLDRVYKPQPLEVYEAGPRRENKKRKKAKDRRKEAAATDTGRKAFSLDLGGDFVSTRVTKKREKTPEKRAIQVSVPCTLKDLSSAIGVKVSLLMSRLLREGRMVSINDLVDREEVEILALEFDLDIDFREEVELTQDDLMEQIVDNEVDRAPRAPIVTFLGHVDHGKTSLLDKIRSASVAAGEAGGITQHITCYRVDRKEGGAVVFVDTPGHAAFSEMRARGANITDVVVLVVAADDGPMPQTEEAIAHARAAQVPIVVAINKVDKPEANSQLTKQKLSALGLQPEEWGGETVMVEVSAHTGQGIEDLLEYLSLESELLNLRANVTVAASGTVLEARRTEGRGIVADVLVQNGTLRRGDIILAGSSFGRVKQIFDTGWKALKEAGPSTPVWVTGLGDIPDAGEKFVILDDVTVAQERAEKQALARRQRDLATRRRRHASLESLFADLHGATDRELRIILKADVAGSLEAIRNEILKLDHKDIGVRLIHSGAGGITEGDVALADASDAIIIGFHVTAEERARASAKAKGVQMRQYSVIYKILDELRAAMEGLLEPEEIEEIVGHAEVRQVFRSSKIGNIAGCRVTDGIVRRNSFVRVARNNIVFYPSDETTKRGTLISLKRLKDDVREVEKGLECGIKIKDFEDIKPEDVLEFFEIRQIKRTLGD